MKTILKVLFFSLLAVIGVVALLLYAVLSPGEIKSEKHIAHVDWLPPAATDITYSKRDGMGKFFVYECSINKEAFLAFSKAQRWNLSEEKDISTGLREPLGLPPLRKIGDITGNIYPKALYYNDRKPNGGGITVIYDLEYERLFVHTSHN